MVQTYTPIRGMIVCAEGGDYVKASDYDLAREINAGLLAALERAEQFIRNGLELGYIDIHDDLDPANETLPIVQAAIAKAKGE